ncbi:MAG: hypothetical protein LBR08_05900 [Bacteroidales bacterium]|jgi:hypothetical protein|nr:hypothetical protein [Bacteroidales bacterium]
MSTRKNYLPANILAFLKFVRNLIRYAQLNYMRWEIPQQSVTELQLPMDALEAAAEVSEDAATRTSAAIKKRNEARTALENVLRPFIQGKLIHNKLVTDDDLTAMALPVHDSKPTHHPAPHSRPAIEVKATNNRQHTVSALNQQTGKKNKPADAYGVRYCREIHDTPPLKASDLRYSVFSRKTTHVTDYDEEDRGKTAYYAACYENSKGEAGPYSDIISAIIP